MNHCKFTPYLVAARLPLIWVLHTIKSYVLFVSTAEYNYNTWGTLMFSLCPLTLKKLKGHIALGLSIRPSIRTHE